MYLSISIDCEDGDIKIDLYAGTTHVETLKELEEINTQLKIWHDSAIDWDLISAKAVISKLEADLEIIQKYS